MRVKHDRNYWLAAACCFATTILALLGDSHNVTWLLMSDVNVALWLFVAWLFDDSRGL